uniref:Uncharacterized protein n=1 Tax=Rhizophora mucronata TaxID=61149 RepID=A0A2P2NAB9_RHIMU
MSFVNVITCLMGPFFFLSFLLLRNFSRFLISSNNYGPFSSASKSRKDFSPLIYRCNF